MTNNKTLSHLKCLITRPQHQAHALCDKIRVMGGTAVLFSTIEIAAPNNNSAFLNAIEHLSSFDIAIFTSANAVYRTFPHWPKKLSKITIAAIGPSTAKSLEQYGIPVDIVPNSPFTSEELLRAPLFSHITKKRIVIFTGENARPFLAETLQSRGAEVFEATVYRRIIPSVKIDDHLHQWQRDGIDVIICTSSESLKNLLELVNKKDPAWLFNSQLLVISERLVQQAQQLGFVKKPIVADNATDEAILAALKAWYANTLSSFDSSLRGLSASQ